MRLNDEIKYKTVLNNSGNDSDPVGVVFEVVSVDPVGNVQSPVWTLGE